MLASPRHFWPRRALTTPESPSTAESPTATRSSPLKTFGLPALQIGVTVALLAWFFRDPEFRAAAAHTVRHANPLWFVVGILIAGIENLIGVFRWRIFLRMLDIELSLGKSIQICLVALFCNTFMLGAVGGDLVRTAYLIRRGNRKTLSLLSVLMDRISGLGALILFTLFLTWWEYDWLSQNPLVANLIKLVIAYQLIAGFLVAASLVIAARGWTNKLPKWAPFPDFVRDLGAGYSKLAHHWRGSLLATFYSFLMLLGFFGVFYCSVRAFNAPLTFLQLSSLMPASDVISALPISAGGLGVREQVFVFLMGHLAAIPAATAFSISLGGYLMNNSWGLVGATLLPLYRGIIRDARKSPP